MLPADSVLCLCAAIVPLLLVEGGSGDNDSSAASKDESLPAGSPQDIVRALRCRRRVFALERELIAREQAEKQRTAFEKAEQGKSEARIMDVNRQLEEKLKMRTEELKRAGQKIIEAQRSLDDTRTQLNERKREITQLKHQLEQDDGLREEKQVREREHSRAMLRSAARETAMREDTKFRAEQLRKCLDGEAVADLIRKSTPDLERSDQMMDQIEADFQARFKRRKEQYQAALQDFEHRIQQKRAEYDSVVRRTQDMTSRSNSSKPEKKLEPKLQSKDGR